MASIGELFIKLGFDVDDKTLKNFDKNIKDLKDGLFDLSAGSVAALYSLDRFIDKTTSSSVAINNFKEQTGLATDATQQWARAASLINPAFKFEDAMNSLQTLQANLTRIQALGQGDILGFSRLGINVAGKNAIQIMNELRENIRTHTSDTERALQKELLTRAGVNAGYMNLFNAPENQFRQFMQLGKQFSLSGGVIDANNKLAQSLEILKTKWETTLETFTGEHAKDLQLFIEDLDKIGTILIKDIEQAGKFKSALEGLAVVMIGIFRPVWLILSAVALAIDDIRAYNEGKESVIGNTEKFLSGGEKNRNKMIYNSDISKYLRDMIKNAGQPDNNLIGPPTPSNYNQSKTINQNISMEIHGASDPHLVAMQVKNMLQSAQNTAFQYQFGTGGLVA